jgi:hypothetical protein
MASAQCMQNLAVQPLSHPLSRSSLPSSVEAIRSSFALLPRPARQILRQGVRQSCRAAVSTGAEKVVSTEARVQLGKSPVEVSPIGVGAWAWVRREPAGGFLEVLKCMLVILFRVKFPDLASAQPRLIPGGVLDLPTGFYQSKLIFSSR